MVLKKFEEPFTLDFLLRTLWKEKKEVNVPVRVVKIPELTTLALDKTEVS